MSETERRGDGLRGERQAHHDARPDAVPDPAPAPAELAALEPPVRTVVEGSVVHSGGVLSGRIRKETEVSSENQTPREGTPTVDGGRGLSRKQFLFGAAAGVAAGVGGAALGAAGAAQAGTARVQIRDSAQAAGGGDLKLVNGKIHTMDGSNPVVSQLSIKDGRFAAVGDGAPAGEGPP
jgi:hypothetical protein